MKLFITGIPTAGKSYLAKKLKDELGAKHVELDDLREGLISHPEYGKWISFYYNQDERMYLENTSPEDKWKHLVKQSEEIWPVFKEEIKKYNDEEGLVVFESVNLLPHLIQRDFPESKQIVLIGESLELTYKRNQESPRWGDTDELQKLEADNFFNVERPRYIEAAKNNNLPVFESADDAFDYIVNSLY